MKRYRIILILTSAFILICSNNFAQDKQAELKLSFAKEDSLNVCKVNVVSEGQPVAEVSVKLFVKRLFGLLPVGEESTDETGVASFEVPNDIPADASGKLTIIAKIEDDENYENVETEAAVNWGVIIKDDDSVKLDRSLSASRENAPIYFIIVSNLIIAGIWGTIFYVILQVFKIKRISSINKKV